jgi:hypothetical protein
MNNELKDVILETLEELGGDEEEFDFENENQNCLETKNINIDKTFLLNLREKLLVLFDGLQSPNIDNLEKKLDLTINFLEFTLSQIDKKLNERDN